MANEKRLISADELLKELEWVKYTVSESSKAEVDEYIERVKRTPTVDAVEVVHGRWVQKEFWPGGGTWRCSECGRQIMFMEDTPATMNMHYCPNCGAKMDGDGNG